MATHYQRLGVAPSASAAEVRAAYRALAQRLHPDRQSSASPAERALADRRMREINEAWQTLSEPARRRHYDDSLRARPLARSSAAQAATRSPAHWPAEEDDGDLVDVMGELGPWQAHVVRGLPWVVLLGVFGAIFVFTAYATAGRSSRQPVPARRPAVAAGTCLRIRSGTTPPVTVPVGCDRAHDVKVVTRVGEATQCPAGTERRRLSTDGLLDCVIAT